MVLEAKMAFKVQLVLMDYRVRLVLAVLLVQVVTRAQVVTLALAVQLARGVLLELMESKVLLALAVLMA